MKKLRNQLDTKRVVLAEAKDKITNLENERDSLITALKLINDDQARASQHQSTVNHHRKANALMTTMVGEKVEEEVQDMIIAMNQDQTQQLSLAIQ